MKLYLTAFKEPKLLEGWKQNFSPIKERSFKEKGVEVEIVDGSILDLSVDAVVSPANSFGYMRGGIDGIYSKRFGLKVEKNVQDLIQRYHFGEMVVGCAEIVETGDSKIPYCISAPTMRVGCHLEDSTTNPYLAARAVFLLWEHGVFKEGLKKGKKVRDTVKSIALPGLGTGVGGVTAQACGYQVLTAFKYVLLGDYHFPNHGQPKDEHHEMWQIDKPEKCAEMQVEDISDHFENSQYPKALLSLFDDKASVIVNDTSIDGEKKVLSYDGKEEISKFLKQYLKDGSNVNCHLDKNRKIPVYDISNIDGRQLLKASAKLFLKNPILKNELFKTITFLF